jgi:hypothetical protein
MDNDLPVPDRGLDIRSAVRAITVVLACLAVYGAYVRYVVARGH